MKKISIALFAAMMLAAGIEVTAFDFAVGNAVITAMITLAGNGSIDMMLAIRGFSAARKKEITKIFVFTLAAPYQSLWLEPSDYRAVIDLIQPDRGTGCCGSSGEWKPFSLLDLIQQNIPDRPLGGAEGRKAVEAAKDLMRANVEESDKIYFHSFRANRNGTHVTARNLAKTLAMAGDAAYRYCSDHNISTCWSAYPSLARDINKAISN